MSWPNKEVETGFKKWCASRPDSVKKLMEKFPFETHWRFVVGAEIYFLLGYTESEKLIVSKTNPKLDYDKAVKNQEYICASCLGDHQVINLH